MDNQTNPNLDIADVKALSHLEIVEKSRVVMRLGKTLLACGAGAYRVKSAMARAAKAVGLDRLESQVSLMEITSTAWQGNNFRTEVVEVRTVGVNATKLDQLMILCTKLRNSMTVDELNAELDRLDKKTYFYPRWITAVASGVACSGFAFLNGGRWVECIAVLFAAGFGQWLRKTLFGKKVTHFAVWIACAAFSTLIYIGLVSAAASLGVVSAGHRVGVISGILYLIPGFPMTTAILDFVRMDFWSAVTRINYCVMVLGSAGVSVVIVTHFVNWQLIDPAPAPLAYWLLQSIRFIASFVATFGFAILFNAPWKVCTIAAVVGGFVNTGRFMLMGVGMPWQMAVGLAAFVIGLLATVIAWNSTHSRVSLSVPAVVIMIPGVPFYKALVAVNAGDFINALGPLFEVFFVVMAIGFGLALARIVTDRGWLFDSNTNILPLDLQKTSRDANI